MSNFELLAKSIDTIGEARIATLRWAREADARIAELEAKLDAADRLAEADKQENAMSRQCLRMFASGKYSRLTFDEWQQSRGDRDEALAAYQSQAKETDDE